MIVFTLLERGLWFFSPSYFYCYIILHVHLRCRIRLYEGWCTKQAPCRSLRACVHAHSVVSGSRPHGLYTPGSSVHLIFPARIWVGCHFLFRGIFSTQGRNLHFLHWQANSLPLSHLGSPYWSFHHINLNITFLIWLMFWVLLRWTFKINWEVRYCCYLFLWNGQG